MNFIGGIVILARKNPIMMPISSSFAISRKYSSIKSTAKWILSKTSKQQMNVLDLGCGPGLYSELFANEGHIVTGVDSINSFPVVCTFVG